MKNYNEFFKRALKNDKISHLYLLSGQSRTHLLDCAKEISYLLLTNAKLNDDKRFKRIKKEQDPNVFFINSNFDNIKKEDILLLQDEFSKTPNFMGKRIYIISSIDTITTSAANVMLKFLEEPVAKNSIGFLLTTNKDKVIPTIISRTQEIVIPDIKKEDFILLLPKDKNGFAKELTYVITRSIDKAIMLLDDKSFLFLVDVMLNMIRDFPNSDILFHIKYYQELMSVITNIKSFKVFAETYFVFFTDLLKEHINDMIFSSLFQEIKEIKKVYKKDRLKKFIEIAEIFNKRANFNITLQIQIFDFLAKLDGERNV